MTPVHGAPKILGQSLLSKRKARSPPEGKARRRILYFGDAEPRAQNAISLYFGAGETRVSLCYGDMCANSAAPWHWRNHVGRGGAAHAHPLTLYVAAAQPHARLAIFLYIGAGA